MCMCVFLNSRSKGPSGQPPQYRQPIKWVPRKTAGEIICLALIIGNFLFVHLFVLILGVMPSVTFFKGILNINNVFRGLQVDFMYVNKTVKVVVWSCYSLS